MKISSLFCCLFYCGFSVAQLRVDSIKNEADIEVFVKQYGKQCWPDWKTNFYMQSGSSYRAENEDKPDSIRYVKWIVADFNRDGKKDLVFSNINSYSSNSSFFSLTSTSSSGYNYFNLWKRYHQYQTFDFNLQTENSSAILFLHENKFYTKDSITTVHFTRSDTLLAAFGGFVEKPKKGTKQAIFDTLTFHFSYFPYMRVLFALPQEMTLTITKTGNVTYEEGGNLYRCFECYDNKTEELGVITHMQFTPAELQEVKDFFALSNFKTKHYLDSTGGSHLDQAIVRFTAGKRIKDITDDGLQGSYWLRLFYTKMFALSKQFRIDIARYFQQHNFDDWQ